MERWFGATVESAARDVLGDDAARVSWDVAAGPADASDACAPVASAGPMPAGEAEGRTRGHAVRAACGEARQARSQWLRLEDFIVGEANRSAWSAVRAIAEDETPISTVVFLHGACGLGKTHLLQGAARRYAEVHPGARVRCTTAEAFTNEYIASVRHGGLKEFRARHRDLDLLCLDDVHFIGGKKGTQSEFLHTFNALGDVRARVVLASDAHPKVLREVQSSIVSRFVSGMVERLDAPDRALREKIVTMLAARRGLVLEAGAAEVLSAGAVGSVRELCGVVARVEAVVRLGGSEGGAAGGVATVAMVRRALGIAGPTGPTRPVRMEEITRAAVEELGIDVAEVYGPSRHRRAVLARSVAVCLAKEITTHSFPEIARMLRRGNHSTVVTQRKRLCAEMDRGGACRCGGELDGVRIADLYDRVRTRVLAAAR
jgi:chromosomal replication initiator protein